MIKTDVEMEDAEKVHDDSGNNIQESECKVIDDEIECEVEAPHAAAASEDVNGREDGGEDLEKFTDEDKGNIVLKIEVEDQPDLVHEAIVPIEGSDGGISNTKNDKKELINTETPANSDTVTTSDVKTDLEDQTNHVNEPSEPVEGSDCGIVTGGSDNTELPTIEIVAEVQTLATSAVEKQGDTINEVVEHGAIDTGVKEDDPAKDAMVDENHGEDVEKSDLHEDVVEKPKEIGKDTDGTEHVAGEITVENADAGPVPSPIRKLPTEFSANEDSEGQDSELVVRSGEDEQMEDAVHSEQDKMFKDKEQGAESLLVSHETDGNEKAFETAAKPNAEESSLANQNEPFTPNSLVRCSSAKTEDHSGETAKTVFTPATLPFMGEDDDGTLEDQAAFMKALEHFYREKTLDFKPPKFYGQPLNCLKLWRAVIRLGGYDRVTGSKLWRQVGESFHPPKTCTTVSWTFRIFYEKSLLEFERHKTQNGELQLPIVMLPEVSGADGEGNGYQGSGSGSGPGRARRDAASRAMQGWHAQRLGAGELGDPVKDKNINNTAKNEKNLKSIGSVKQKRPNEVEHSNKAARTDISKQLVASVVDVGPPADWVKINVRQAKDCFEVYALVPGLLREEVRVQSDPAGRLVITGQPEQVDNPWGITPFKKIISLPARIHPVETSAVVSLHGRLFVRVPFEQPNSM